jgi:hypothetical protein
MICRSVLCSQVTKELFINSISEIKNLMHSFQVVTLTKPENRKFGETRFDEQLHVLPNYRVEVSRNHHRNDDDVQQKPGVQILNE